jgi:uncharacterized protein YqeY
LAALGHSEEIMTLIEHIRADQLQARKDKDTIKVNLLTTLIGEAVSIGKNNGNRETTDAEVVALAKKFIKNLQEAITTYSRFGVNTDNQVREVSILEAYIPKQMTTEQLKEAVAAIKVEISASPKDMGKVMALLKARHDGQYDGKVASTIVKEVLA